MDFVRWATRQNSFVGTATGCSGFYGSCQHGGHTTSACGIAGVDLDHPFPFSPPYGNRSRLASIKSDHCRAGETDGHVLQTQDAYLNVAGGVRLDEPAVDLAVAVSIASSLRDVPTKPDDVIFGEIGLTGEVRAVSRAEQRVKEAAKLGFKRVILPEKA